MLIKEEKIKIVHNNDKSYFITTISERWRNYNNQDRKYLFIDNTYNMFNANEISTKCIINGYDVYYIAPDFLFENFYYIKTKKDTFTVMKDILHEFKSRNFVPIFFVFEKMNVAERVLNVFTFFHLLNFPIYMIHIDDHTSKYIVLNKEMKTKVIKKLMNSFNIT